MNNNLKVLFSAGAFALAFSGLAPAAESMDLGEITVTGLREETPKARTAETSGGVSAAQIQEVKPGHPTEIMGRIPGVHVNITGGEGHMTAIRQPLTTSPVYLFLEDGIPTRSTGFFNHNALYEVNIPQAGGVEVTKGPGTALYGSDAIGGVVNVLTAPPPAAQEASLTAEFGEYGWKRLLATAGDSWEQDGLRGDLNITHTDGWRDGTEYDRQSATVRWDRFLDTNTSMKTVVAASNIDQQTAGTSVLPKADYLNNPTLNYTPISYREVQALRVSMAYEKEDAQSLLSVTPYVRQNSMDYMPNWSFTYDPNVSDASNNSFGLLLKYRHDLPRWNSRVVVGADIDHSPGTRTERSIDAIKEGNIYTSYTLGPVIYDYDVTYQAVSPYLHLEAEPVDRLRLIAGLRYDSMSYDYDNKMADGTLVVRPTSTSFPVVYNHPSDTTVDFSHLSPKFGVVYSFTDDLNGFASYRHAFRAPSESQLFRPGKAANSTGLDPVKADSYELGVRGKVGHRVRYEASVYRMIKTDDILTYKYPDNSQEIMNAGETLHEGFEIGASIRLTERLIFDMAYANTRHTYEDWSPTATVDYSGNEMSAAPEEIINARLAWRPAQLNGGRVELEWERLGSYWMDDENTVEYGGHDLFNLRASYPVDERLEVYARIMNLLDETYATRAQYSTSKGEEYAPGMPRTFYAGVGYRF